MKRILIKVGVLAVTFILSLIVISKILNKGNNDLTVEVKKASLPVMYFLEGDERYNPLYGYTKPMNAALERNSISVLSDSREISAVIDTKGASIDGLSFEVRDLSGERLIESTEINDYTGKDGEIFFTISVKDLIKADTEYSLVILTKSAETTVRFYTHIVWTDTYALPEKLAFARSFSDSTFDKAKAQEMRRYLESNSLGDNSSFAKVNIHSSFSQVTWGDMKVEKETESVFSVKEIDASTASLETDFVVSTKNEGENDKKEYLVREFFRVKKGTDRMYLLDYQRTMEEVLRPDSMFSDKNKIRLGIITQPECFTESEDGNILVFENCGRLFSYDIAANRLSVLYGEEEPVYSDSRQMNLDHRAKVLNVDGNGNVRFLVYGYQAYGRHEGEVGIELFTFDGALNTLEEEVYIPYAKEADVLIREMEPLHFVNDENMLYVILNRAVYLIDLEAKTYEIMLTNEVDETLFVSESGKMMVWQTSTSPYTGEELLLMDLDSHGTIAIDSEPEDYIYPMGFIGEDLVYGLTHKEDSVKDATGKTLFPMYAIYIRSTDGHILKQYKLDNVYVTDYTIEDSLITLKRVSKKDETTYTEISDDQIMNNAEQEKGTNELVSENDPMQKKVHYIKLKKTVETGTLQVRNPKEVLFEGGREINVKFPDSPIPFYYAYGPNGLDGIFASPANAVKTAYNNSGVVVNELGEYVFKKGNRIARNQILSIKEKGVNEGENSISTCIDTILEREGIVRNSFRSLMLGMTPYEILKDSFPEYDVLDLTDCPLDSVLYYVGKDIPVMALLDNNEAVLITGYNERQVVILNPSQGTLSKMRMSEADEWFTKNSNRFLTYHKPVEN